ncbi:MAG: T9SS type A sorting domain-containing protein [Ignavibacteria bacterium]
MRYFFSFIILFTFMKTSLYSQDFIQKFDGINFNINGNISYAPFNGGLNNARFQYIDIDGNNTLDLFMFDSDTTLYYYKNTGTPQNASYKLTSSRFENLHFRNWFYFVDMDNDSDNDLFTGGENQTVKYYKNTGSASVPSFILMIEELRTSTDTVIYSESNSVPIFYDLDGDGDKDFFTGQQLGTIAYYENIGSQNNFSFKFITDIWQDLLIISPALLHNNNMFNDNERHGANSLEFTDIDNDNDFDLFWGDLFSKGIYYIQNNGSATTPDVAILDSIYPHNSSFISQGYNSTRFVDIDADGDKDLFISVLYLSQNVKNFVFYRNNGSASIPDFQRVSDNYLNNVDVGGTSNISFVDIDNDNDKDLFIGSDLSRISYFRNEGTSQVPSFTLISDSLPILSASFNYAPSFADLDNDGDKDMILGSYIKDSLWFYRNTGSSTSFNFTLEARGHQIGLSTLGQSSTPAFADIDNDNDKDLFIGATNGRIFFYENTGTAANFQFTFRINFYNSIDVGDESVPRFFDIDNDNDQDLFIGTREGKIVFYRNDGNSQNPNFVFQTNEYKNINVQQYACPEFVDIDNDTDPDLFAGNNKGGLFYFENNEVSGINILSANIPEGFKLYQNYPNPFNPVTTIKFDVKTNSIIKLNIFDALGKHVTQLVDQTLNAGSYSFMFNASDLPSGIYFYKIESSDFSENKKMLFIK